MAKTYEQLRDELGLETTQALRGILARNDEYNGLTEHTLMLTLFDTLLEANQTLKLKAPQWQEVAALMERISEHQATEEAVK